MKYLEGKPIKYYPFPGHIHSHPSILDGAIDEIVAHARFLESKGVRGLDLLSYRFVGYASLSLAHGDSRLIVHCLIRNLCEIDRTLKTS